MRAEAHGEMAQARNDSIRIQAAEQQQPRPSRQVLEGDSKAQSKTAEDQRTSSAISLVTG